MMSFARRAFIRKGSTRSRQHSVVLRKGREMSMRGWRETDGI